MRALAVVFILTQMAATASAGGFSLSEQTAVAGGSGGASTARTDDAGAAWYNPAALADDKGLRVGVSVLAAFSSVSAEGTDTADGMGPWSTSSEGGVKTPGSLQLAYSTGRWSVGLAVGVPFASGVEWPASWPGRHEIRRSQITVVRTAPFFAWRLGPRLAISAGVHIDAARMEIGRDLDFIAEEGDVAIDMDGWGVGAHASLHAQPRDDIALGLTYKSRTHLALDGGANFDAPLAFSTKTMDQTVSTEITTPDRLILGGRWQRGALSFLGDVELTFWSVHDELTVDFERDETPDVIQTNEWSTTMALRGGAELELDGATHLRGGLFFDPSPVPSETLAPSSPDSDRVGLTLGVSRQLPGSLEIDAFYELLSLLGSESASDETLAARYSGRAHFFGLGLRWHPTGVSRR